MADFAKAFQQTYETKGGYANDPQDPGGETCRGIARKMNPKWDGWVVIDKLRKQKGFPAILDQNAPLFESIKRFYEVNYWDKVRGDELSNQEIANSIVDFAVNAGPATSVKLAQSVVGSQEDGVIGIKTLEKINADDPRAFLALFALRKINCNISICEQRSESPKFFYGWVKRALEGI